MSLKKPHKIWKDERKKYLKYLKGVKEVKKLNISHILNLINNWNLNLMSISDKKFKFDKNGEM